MKKDNKKQILSVSIGVLSILAILSIIYLLFVELVLN